MTSDLTLPKLDKDVLRRLQVRAAVNDRSLQAEILDILKTAAYQDLPVEAIMRAITRTTSQTVCD